MKNFLVLSCVSVILIFTVFNYPGDVYGWSCGREIVSVGDSKGKVLARCGSPESSYVANEKQSGTFGGRVRSRGYYSGTYRSTTAITEVWIYNCGSGDYLYELRFEGDVLIGIQSVGDGSGWKGCRSAEERRILELD